MKKLGNNSLGICEYPLFTQGWFKTSFKDARFPLSTVNICWINDRASVRQKILQIEIIKERKEKKKEKKKTLRHGRFMRKSKISFLNFFI